jgi:hypothetical protein
LAIDSNWNPTPLNVDLVIANVRRGVQAVRATCR